MKAILIDDEIIALDLLMILLNPYKDIDIVGRYINPKKALEEIEKTKPDIVFLDIEIGDMNGIEFAEQLLEKKDDLSIVFVTAYPQYAVEAFRLEALDYLLKPIDSNRLKDTIARLNKRKSNGNGNPLPSNIYINSLGSFILLDEEKKILSWRTQKSKELFVYLWVNRNSENSKKEILENVFPDKNDKKATSLLHTTMYQIRKNLEELGYPNAIKFKNESYKLNMEIESDINELEKLLEMRSHKEKDIEKIINLYKGDFLQSENYSWANEEQQKYRSITMNILEGYINKQFEKKDYNMLVKQTLDKLYYLSPFNEDIVRKIIIYYGELDKKGDLKDYYKEFIKILWKEMKIEPQKKTIELYNKYMK